jgi:hypothetical protein
MSSRSRKRPRRGPAGIDADKGNRFAGEPVGRALGLDSRDIPGGQAGGHLVNAQTIPTRPQVPPEADLFAPDSLLDHGVYDPDTEPTWRKPSPDVGRAPRPAPEPKIDDAVPVYIVPRPKRRTSGASPRRVAIPASGNPPVRLFSENEERVGVSLLNESATIIRIGETESDAANYSGTPSGGAALPASMTSYLWISTQDSLYAVADSGASELYLSVIEEFGEAGR